MGMPITAIGEKTTGHGCFPPTTIVQGSPNVIVENSPAGRLTDKASPHCCFGCHGLNIACGSSTVFINNLNAGRIGDCMSCGDTVATGKMSIIVGG